jgi:hypothetical protein
MSYINGINKDTLATTIAADTANSQEVAWMAKIVMGAKKHCPIANWFGSVGGGRPIMEIGDWRKLQGQEIVAKRRARLGARGRQGDSARVGYEEKFKERYFRAKIGAMFHSVGFSRIAAAQTAMGGDKDKVAQELLSEWVAERQYMDVEAEIFRNCYTSGAITGRNVIRPNSKGSENALGSNDVFGMDTITDARDAMLSLNASPLMISQGVNMQKIPRFYIQGSQYLFASLNRNSTFKTLIASAENRGPSQSLLAGGKPIVDNTILNEWMITNNDADATQGARLIPFATTGVAIPADPQWAENVVDSNLYNESTTADADGFLLTLGGSAAAALKTDVDYAQNFHNAPYQGFEGEKIAADTTTERYLAVRARSGANAGLWRLFAYKVNNGNAIVLTRALGSSGGTGASASSAGSIVRQNLSQSAPTDVATWGSGQFTDTSKMTEAEIAIGAEVYQCNVKGTILSYGYVISDGFMMSGYGSLDGKTAFGNRKVEKQEYEKDIGIGVELVWGCKANEDTNGVKNGFVLIQAAYTPPGYYDNIPSS